MYKIRNKYNTQFHFILASSNSNLTFLPLQIVMEETLFCDSCFIFFVPSYFSLIRSLIWYCDVFMKNIQLLYFAVVELFIMDISAASNYLNCLQKVRYLVYSYWFSSTLLDQSNMRANTLTPVRKELRLSFIWNVMIPSSLYIIWITLYVRFLIKFGQFLQKKLFLWSFGPVYLGICKTGIFFLR